MPRHELALCAKVLADRIAASQNLRLQLGCEPRPKLGRGRDGGLGRRAQWMASKRVGVGLPASSKASDARGRPRRISMCASYPTPRSQFDAFSARNSTLLIES